VRNDRTRLFRGIARYGSRHPRRFCSLYGPRVRGGSGNLHAADRIRCRMTAASLLVTVELVERDPPGGDEAEEQDEGAVLGRQGPCVFTPRRNSSLSRWELNHVDGAQCLPLCLGKAEEHQQIRARFRAASPPVAVRPQGPGQFLVAGSFDRSAHGGIDQLVTSPNVLRSGSFAPCGFLYACPWRVPPEAVRQGGRCVVYVSAEECALSLFDI
jgi:hypothetical protein